MFKTSERVKELERQPVDSKLEELEKAVSKSPVEVAKEVLDETTEKKVRWFGTVKGCKKLRVRDYPNTSSSVIGYLKEGQRVELTVADFGQDPKKFQYHRMKNTAEVDPSGLKAAGYLMGEYLDVEVVEE